MNWKGGLCCSNIILCSELRESGDGSSCVVHDSWYNSSELSLLRESEQLEDLSDSGWLVSRVGGLSVRFEQLESWSWRARSELTSTFMLYPRVCFFSSSLQINCPAVLILPASPSPSKLKSSVSRHNYVAPQSHLNGGSSYHWGVNVITYNIWCAVCRGQ